jgi:modulator of FtsH protease
MLFSKTMNYVAATAAFFAVGAYLARDISAGWSWLAFAASFVALIVMQSARSRDSRVTVGLLFGFGLLLGVASAPTLVYYADSDPGALWQAGGATALFIAGFGAFGYGTRRDLSAYARTLTFALLGLIVFGVVAIFVAIPGGAVIYALAGLAIFAGLTAYDFQRLRRIAEFEEAPLLAASIFLDIFNVFLFFLSLGSGSKE